LVSSLGKGTPYSATGKFAGSAFLGGKDNRPTRKCKSRKHWSPFRLRRDALEKEGGGFGITGKKKTSATGGDEKKPWGPGSVHQGRRGVTIEGQGVRGGGGGWE